MNKTRDLSETDFSDPAKLFTSNNFDIVKTCTETNALQECWHTKKSDDGSEDYNGPVTLRTIKGDKVNGGIWAGPTVILKNGTVMNYFNVNTKNLDTYKNLVPDTYALFDIDVNGKEGPNIIGRDVYTFLITKNGKVAGYSDSDDHATTVQKCKYGTGMGYCSSALIQSNWKVDY